MDNYTAFTDLRNILVTFYNDERSIRRIIAEAGLEIGRIEFSGQATNDWHAALTEAINVNKFQSLMQVVFGEYGTNRQLFEVYDSFRVHNIQKKELDRILFENVEDAGVGIKDTLKNVTERLLEIKNQMTSIAQNKGAVLLDPIYFDSKQACIDAYVESLYSVDERFWTTTYLNSGFWVKEDFQVATANRAMLHRLIGKRGSVKRLFLLNEPLQSSVNSLEKHWRDLRKMGKEEDIINQRHALQVVKNAMYSLGQQGTIIRIVHDNPQLNPIIQSGKAKEIDFETGDSEIAIYDVQKVHIYGGAKNGIINDVKIFPSTYIHFYSLLEQMEKYFNILWDLAIPIEEFFQDLDDVYDFMNSQIDYKPNWLAKYEYALPAEDIATKDAEINFVTQLLHKLGLWGNMHRYLDIGTCTGRYPIKLREAIAHDGEIIGIDNDLDCIAFAKGNWLEKTNSDPRIKFDRIDAREIPDIGKFDLVTCMLGTISHFGSNKKSNFDDTLQQVLKRMVSLLIPGGVLIISNWSGSAIRRETFLSIYESSDCKRLIEWTPSVSDLKKRLDAVGLEIIEARHPTDRLDLIVCKNKIL